MPVIRMGDRHVPVPPDVLHLPHGHIAGSRLEVIASTIHTFPGSHTTEAIERASGFPQRLNLPALTGLPA